METTTQECTAVLINTFSTVHNGVFACSNATNRKLRLWLLRIIWKMRPFA